MTALVYVSPLPWHSFAQRPHKFVEWFHARHGGPVLWIDPYPTRLPGPEDLRRLRTKLRGGSPPAARALPGWLTVLPAPALPIEPLPGSGLLNGLLWRKLHQAVARFGADGPSFRAAREALENVIHFIAPLSPGADFAAAPAAAGQGADGGGGVIVQRQQALAQLRQVADFFRRTEPHSPVAYLAEKAASWGELPLHLWLRAVVKDSGTLAQLDEMLGTNSANG